MTLDAKWDLQIHNVAVDPSQKVTVIVQLTPTEHALRASLTETTRGLFTKELKNSYREAIERGDWQLYRVV